MTRSLKLAGFDVRSDRLVVEIDVPQAACRKALEIAGVKDAPSDGLADIPLSHAAAEKIAKLLGRRIDVRAREFFLEVSARRLHAVARAHA